ncbi:MAG TPA: phospholipase D-like domain-containing protein, partial [Thermoanaerobaculia bacterium]|nr:phospholipase D-like domain-containing protein [Thermoanaerobaculia bacterium]
HGVFRYLLEQGVRIFEYETSVLHAKTVVVDGFSSLVGSTNMDFRSFHFNSECNVLVLDGAVAESLERQFAMDLAGAKEITLAEWGRRTSLHEFGDFCARALSPVL